MVNPPTRLLNGSSTDRVVNGLTRSSYNPFNVFSFSILVFLKKKQNIFFELAGHRRSRLTRLAGPKKS